MRALDHIVWPARNLDALAASFRALGFMVGPRNRHPWGTVNHIVQFDGAFLELLGFADDAPPVRPDDPAHPFAGFCADVLAGSEARAAMIVLRSDDAMADAVRFRAAGLGAGRVLPFSRAARGPDGRDRTVSFTTAFAELPGLQGLGAFTCQQHHPENFWDAAMQRHPNGATGIAAVRMSAPEPHTAVAALMRFADEEGGASDDPGLVSLDNAALRVTQAPTMQADAARIDAIEITVKDLNPLETMPTTARLHVRRERDGVTASLHGATALVFRRASRSGV